MKQREINILSKEIVRIIKQKREDLKKEITEKANKSFEESKLSQIEKEYNEALSNLIGSTFETDRLRSSWINNQLKKANLNHNMINLEERIIHELNLKVLLKPEMINIEELINEMVNKFG